MERELIVTNDGSHTVLIPQLDIAYHSLHGAIQESMHVFIETGLRYKWANTSGNLTIFEVGLGTGLNALLTCKEAVSVKRKINYISIEPFPLDDQMLAALNFPDEKGLLGLIHAAAWNEPVAINEFFTMTNLKSTLADAAAGHASSAGFDLVYFDAFGPEAQPELWTEESFKGIAGMMKPGGVLVTYCSKSIVRKAMGFAGLQVKKVPGPWGKREMVRATK